MNFISHLRLDNKKTLFSNMCYARSNIYKNQVMDFKWEYLLSNEFIYIYLLERFAHKESHKPSGLFYKNEI